VSACAVRAERDGDAPAIHRVVDRAFGRANEAALVDALRGHAQPRVSLVATVEDEIIAHVLLTPVTIEVAPASLTMGLAPLAVAPEHQRRGVGSRLVRDGLDACRALDCALVFVLGEPAYYRRFGFEPAHRYDLRGEYDAPADAFMVIELIAGALRGARGLVRYRTEFSLV
jgi:putative acetyltransferase